MPPYELAVIVRNGLKRPDLKEALKRVCGYIHNKGGVIKSMENHGEKVLPISMKKDHVKYSHGNYFFMGVHLPADNRQDLSEVIDGDLDILFHRVMKETVEPPRPCLFRPCQFGEIVKPDYDRSLFKTNTIRKLKNRKVLRK